MRERRTTLLNKVLSLLAVLIILGGVNFYIYQKLPTKTDIATVQSELSAKEQEASNQEYPGSDLDKAEALDYPTLVEIEITPTDVKKSEIGGTLGINTPFNNQFISEEEVGESVVRILGEGFDLAAIDEQFKEYLISVRSIEIMDGVPERNSLVADKYEVFKNAKETDEVDALIETEPKSVTDALAEESNKAKEEKAEPTTETPEVKAEEKSGKVEENKSATSTSDLEVDIKTMPPDVVTKIEKDKKTK